MKVYIITAGEYSSYHIEAVFTDENMAQQYANLDSDRNIEEYETDIESVNPDPTKLIYRVSYNFENNKVETLYLTSGYNKEDDCIHDWSLNVFDFYVSPHETLNDSIRMYGMHSDWLHKIAVDRFYMYCDAHETSRQELIEKKKKRDDEFHKRYMLYTTSSATVDGDGLFNPYWHADRRMPDLMKQYFAEHGTYPDTDTLKKMYAEQTEEVKAKHEQDKLR